MAQKSIKTKAKANKPAMQVSKQAVQLSRLTSPKNQPAKTKPAGSFSKLDLRKIIGSPKFPKFYALASVAILLLTSIFWALLGANLQRGNADQLVNSYLMDHVSTFHNALLPGQHTFLIKWPLFWLVKVFGYSGSAFAIFTVATVLATVAVLAAILYKIERRPLVFGTLCLALASVLLMVPAQPYAGGILPVNMAMLTTRNLEYLVYVGSLALLIRSKRIRSWKFLLAFGTLATLIASDKLFLTLSVGGALLALVIYAVSKGWNLVSQSVNWLLAGIASMAGAVGLLWFINQRGITHITSQANVSPYGLVRNAHDLALGGIQAFLGLLTNFGANPAFDATRSRDIPSRAANHLLAPGGITFMINFIILACGILVVFKLLQASMAHNKDKTFELDRPSRLSIMLIWSSLAALGIFVASNHDFVVDSRYLTIALFAVFVSVASYARKKEWKMEKIAVTGLIISAGILLGLTTTIHTYISGKAALATVNDRNDLVAKALSQHPVNVLVGDYWRVVPTRLASGNKLSVMPLSGCTQARDVLSSKAWQPDLKNHSFAYLLSLDIKLTDYPKCSLNDIVKTYGQPNSSTLIAGSLSKPQELLLFYDKGINNSAPTTPQPSIGTATIVPTSLEELPNTSCSAPTTMNIVAHQDDDLLFLSPDLLRDVQAGHCIRTIYVTAGDAGSSQLYWLGREQGSEAAYSKMIGSNDIWIQRIVELPNHQYITVANPRGNPKISLVFMHLPDGGLKGQGFRNSHYENLAKLESGMISSIRSVDNQSSYNSAQLTEAMTSLMHVYQPSEIHTQSSYASSRFPDHSDHIAVGSYAKRAHRTYEERQFEGRVTIPIHFYIGYPIHEMPENISGKDLMEKEQTFFSYSRDDPGVCQSIQQCEHTQTYGNYLKRQYQSPQ